jgi:hypothetical protein
MDKRSNDKEININELSPHLFWDVEREKIKFNKNKKWIVQRVLEYGLLNDWVLIYKYYGIEEIAQIVMKMKNLERKSITFISVLSKIPKEKFSCYTTKQSPPGYLNF